MAASKIPGLGAPEFEREPMRESFEDHLKRAADRMAVLRGHFGDEILDAGTDEFYIAPSDIPPGWDYQWKRHTLLGKEDPAYQVQLARAGWEPVKTRRHPHFMPDGSKDTFITRKGMILMERPLELTRQAERAERDKARKQVRNKEEQITAAPPGQFDRSNKGDSMTSVKKGYVPMPVPEG